MTADAGASADGAVPDPDAEISQDRASGVEIVWNGGTMGEWAALQRRLARPPLTQSFGYAVAMGKAGGFVPRLGVIRRDGAALGIVQILQRRYLKLARQSHLHRGPLWFDGVPADDVLAGSFRLLRAACPHGPLSRASVLPELPAGAGHEAVLAAAGFRRSGPGYRTVWLDLGRDEAALRAGLSATWRQRLKGAMKAGLTIDADPAARHLPWLLAQDHDHARERGFRTVSGPLAVRLRNALMLGDGVLLVRALEGETPVAAGLFFLHAHAATYQIGWAGEAGRRSNAMRLVLWEAIRALKARGITALDLGGINPESAPGVTEFKTSTGGEAVETVGLYR